VIEALAVGGWLFGCAALGLQALGVRLPKRHGSIIPTRAQRRCSQSVVLDDKIMSPCDRAVLRSNEERIILAYQLGLDVALHRADRPPEFLCAGENPSASVGFVVVRNKDS
jgi:hypothetical protein